MVPLCHGMPAEMALGLKDALSLIWLASSYWLSAGSPAKAEGWGATVPFHLHLITGYLGLLTL